MTLDINVENKLKFGETKNTKKSSATILIAYIVYFFQ